VGTKPLQAVEFFAALLPGDQNVNVNMYDKADKSGNIDMLSQNPMFGTLLWRLAQQDRHPFCNQRRDPSRVKRVF
jgi:hypothetical protein